MQKFSCSLSDKQESRLSRLQYEQRENSSTEQSAREQLNVLLSMLPKERGELLRRFWIDGDSVDEIAKDLGISRKATYQRLRKTQLRLMKSRRFLFRTHEKLLCAQFCVSYSVPMNFSILAAAFCDIWLLTCP